MLKLKLIDYSLCLRQVYGPNASAQCHVVVKESSDALRKTDAKESMMLLSDINTQVGKDPMGIWVAEQMGSGVRNTRENNCFTAFLVFAFFVFCVFRCEVHHLQTFC